MKLPKVYFPVKLPNPIPLDRCDGGRPKFALEAPFNVYIDGTPLTIPAGIEFDYASVPRIFTNIFPPNHPNYQAASLLHDVGYQGELWPRNFCDKLFLAAMAGTGVERWKRNTMWFAVRIGGGQTYRQHSAESIARVRALMSIYNQTRPLWGDWEEKTATDRGLVPKLLK